MIISIKEEGRVIYYLKSNRTIRNASPGTNTAKHEYVRSICACWDYFTPAAHEGIKLPSNVSCLVKKDLQSPRFEKFLSGRDCILGRLLLQFQNQCFVQGAHFCNVRFKHFFIGGMVVGFRGSYKAPIPRI